MPLGDIRPRELTTQEKKWRKGWMRWEGHEFKDMLPTLRHMSAAEFRAWTRTIDPRSVLILSTEPLFREVFTYQANKSWYHEVIDWLWRMKYGNH